MGMGDLWNQNPRWRAVGRECITPDHWSTPFRREGQSSCAKAALTRDGQSSAPELAAWPR
jgi:hypothetical protein